MVTGEGELSRLRREHQQKGLHAFNQHVESLMARDPNKTRSMAQYEAMRAHPDLWAQAKMGKVGEDSAETELPQVRAMAWK